MLRSGPHPAWSDGPCAVHSGEPDLNQPNKPELAQVWDGRSPPEYTELWPRPGRQHRTADVCGPDEGFWYNFGPWDWIQR